MAAAPVIPDQLTNGAMDSQGTPRGLSKGVRIYTLSLANRNGS